MGAARVCIGLNHQAQQAAAVQFKIEPDNALKGGRETQIPPAPIDGQFRAVQL